MKKSNRIMNIVLLASLVFVLVFGVAQPVAAFEMNNNGKLASGAVVDDDLFITGEKVVVDGTVNGILFAFGNTITINGIVNGDVIAAGSTIIVNEGAKISGNLFTGAQSVDVRGMVEGSVLTGVMSLVLDETSSVGRNLYFGGFSLEAKPGSMVKQDVAAGGYQVILGGEVGRDVNAGVAAFKLDGSIGRDAQIQVDKPGTAQANAYNGPWSAGGVQIEMIDPGLYIGKDSSIGGDLVYTSPVDQTNSVEATPQGSMVYQTPVPTDTDTETKQPSRNIRFELAIWKFFKNMAKNFVSILALGALALWLIPLTVNGVTKQFGSKTLASLGYGFLTYLVGWFGTFAGFVVLVVAAIILGLISFGGLGGVIFWTGSSTLLLAFSIFMTLALWGTKIIAAYFVGAIILQKGFKQASPNMFLALLIGVIIYVPLRAIPILGWLVDVFITLVGLGAIWLFFRERTKPAFLPELPAAE